MQHRRPCQSEHLDPSATYGSCKWCWLFVKNPRWRRLWSARPGGATTGAGDAPSAVRPLTGQALLWSYGLTTVPQRRDSLLPRTLASLKAGGFGEPWLFVDGTSHADAASYERDLGLPVVARHTPSLRTFGNWVLALAELYIREPNADRYALFQDDLVTMPGLRGYLDRCPMPESGVYWNGYSFPVNEQKAPLGRDGRPQVGWHDSNQCGFGAVMLVFSRSGVRALIHSADTTSKPLHPSRGWRNVDGLIVTAMRKAGYREQVHYPSLVQHTGGTSTMANRPHQAARSFRGEDFNCLDLLGEW